MAITLLRVAGFRNLSSVELSPSTGGLNIIHGENGSGKTSLLEAIYCLSHGRSFRSTVPSMIINHQVDQFSLFAQLINESNNLLTMGIERHRGGALRLRTDKRDTATISELASYLPVRMINPYSYQLVESGPLFRRKYLDWGLFYQNPAFLPCWRLYERVLKQRNSLLRSKRSKQEIDPWTVELIKYGEELTQLRQDYVRDLLPFVQNITNELLQQPNLVMTYQPGWNTSFTYRESLDKNFTEDWQFGCTQIGPHRAELDININGLAAKHFLSRGQQKLLICAIILAQGLLLTQVANKRLVYLVDDLPSELDEKNKVKLISLLLKQKMQIFITAIESKSIVALIDQGVSLENPVAVFHVKHGQVINE
jgi:DNA replication and repair protein RecF